MKFRILRHHSGGVVIRAFDRLGGPPAYAICYAPELLAKAGYRRSIRSSLRRDLPVLREALMKRL